MKSKNITIDELAQMVNRGFDNTEKRIDKGFKEINFRLDKIENLILADHKKRIERLENEVKELRELFALK